MNKPGLQTTVWLMATVVAAAGPVTAEKPDATPTDNRVSSTEISRRLETAVVVEWVVPPTLRRGQPVPCQLVVRNVSGSAVDGVVVRSEIPAGVTVRSTEPQAANDGRSLTWNLGRLAPREEKRIRLNVVPDRRGDFDCQATVTVSGSTGARLRVREPQLHLDARAPAKVIKDELATITLVVSNPGDGVAENVVVKATLPKALEHPKGPVVQFAVGNLAPNESRKIQLVCTARAGGQFRCDAEAIADGDLHARQAAQVHVVVPQIDLQVHGPKLRYLDRPATYRFEVSNRGTATANNVVLTDRLPPGLKFVSATDGGRYDSASRVVSWFIGELPPEEARRVHLKVVAIGLGEQKHRAEVAAARGLRTQAEIATRVDGLSALLIELVDVDDPVEVGAETSYEIRITNTGSKTETNLRLVCTLPEQMEFLAARSPSPCRHHLVGRKLEFAPLPKLAPRADALYRIRVRGKAAGDLRFRAEITADGLSVPVIKEESTKVYGDEGDPQ